MPILPIEKTINGGYGLTKTEEGQVVLVAGGLPGEELNIKLGAEKKGFRHGKIKSFHSPHPQRVTPPCPYIKSCGGCNLQHASQDLQTDIKTDIVKEALARSGNQNLIDFAAQVLACLPSPQEYGYRQRLRLHVIPYEGMGFRGHKSHDLVEIDSCMLAKDEINLVLAALTGNQDHDTLCQQVEQLELLWNPVNGAVNLVYHLLRKPRPADLNRAKAVGESIDNVERIFFIGKDFSRQPVYSTVSCEGATLQQSYTVSDKGEQRPVDLEWEIGGFCQVNLEQNRVMIEQALALLAVQQNESVLDLYCGMGNFSIPLAHNAQQLVGYEGQGSAIRSAKKNAQTNNLDNCTFYKRPVHKAVQELITAKTQFDCLIIDPPRQGAPGLAQNIAQLIKERIVYISCDPATLGRDLAALVAEGFSIQTVQPIDMFPQTHHIETIVLLKKDK